MTSGEPAGGASPAVPDQPLPLQPSSPAGVVLYRFVAHKCGLLNDAFAGRVFRRAAPGLQLFLSFLLMLGAVVPVVWAFVLRQYERLAPGVLGWVVARTKWIDRVYAESDAEQVVILAAGFDCRFYRLASPAGARLVEVDRPAGQSDKLALLAALGGKAEALKVVTFAPVDIEAAAGTGGSAALAAALAGAGVHPSLRTLFILESGLTTMSRAAGAATLATVGTYPPGSRLAVAFLSSQCDDATESPPGYGAAAHRANRGPYAYVYPPGGESLGPWLVTAIGRGATVEAHLTGEQLESSVLSRCRTWPRYACGDFRCLAAANVALVPSLEWGVTPCYTLALQTMVRCRENGMADHTAPPPIPEREDLRAADRADHDRIALDGTPGADAGRDRGRARVGMHVGGTSQESGHYTTAVFMTGVDGSVRVQQHDDDTVVPI